MIRHAVLFVRHCVPVFHGHLRCEDGEESKVEDNQVTCNNQKYTTF